MAARREPQLDCVFGDHPFVLEVRVTTSPDPLITSIRAGRTMREVATLLAGFVEGSIHPLVIRPFYGCWVTLPGEERQPAYLYPDYPTPDAPSSDDFSPPGTLAPVVALRDLFGLFGRTAGHPLCIPAELTETLMGFRLPGRFR